MFRRPTTLSEPQRSELETALHEDFKRLARLSAARPLTTPIDATVLRDGQTFKATCIEVSNEGVGLLVPQQVAAAVGEVLQLGALHRGEEVLMGEVTCTVERVSSVEGTELLFVAAHFVPSENAPALPLRITSPLRVRVVLEAACSGGTRFTVATDHSPVEEKFESARIEDQQLYLPRPSPRGAPQWQPGQIVTVSFEANGRQLTGHAAVVIASGHAVVLHLPRVLAARPPRTDLRALALPPGASITFVSPLSGLLRCRTVLQLSATGASFKVDPADVVPPGLRLERVMLEFASERLHFSAITTSVGHLAFTSVSAEERQRLVDLLLHHRVEGAACGSSVAFPRIWELFREEGALWRDHSGPPSATQQLLGDGSHGLSKTVVVQREGELAAHSSGLRIYSRTWLAQHLLVKSGFHRAGTLSQQVLSLSFEYGEALADVEYVRGLWRVSSRAERIYDGVSSRLLKPGLAYRVRFEPMRLPTAAFVPAPLRVRAAGPDDERAFLAFASASEDPVKLLSDDLVPGELRLETLSRRFGALGLSRGRSLVVVQDDRGAPLGWALLETMSPGLFWAEMYTSFRIFLLDASGALAAQARSSLASWATLQAARAGRREVECHASNADVEDLQSLGFVRLGPVYEFGAHRSVVRDFITQMNSVLARVRRRDNGDVRPMNEPDGLTS
ncbi:MAG: hypothetical protein Q8N23_28555 [Archangium sp.]|nr:hypothetical protein [Archangium sp.]MDP3570598.1 hypothetical protein [Archangium sp.]